MNDSDLSALISALGTMANNVSQIAVTKKNYKYAKQMWEMQRDENRRTLEASQKFALDMWNQNNEYNSPYNQMQRLKVAGINPHLAFAKGTINNVASLANNPSGFSAPSALPGQQPKLDSYGQVAEMIYNRAMMEQNIEASKASIANTNANTARTEQQTQTEKEITQREKNNNSLFENVKRMVELDRLMDENKYEISDKTKSAYIKAQNLIAERVQAQIDKDKAQTDYINGPQTDLAYSSINLNSAKAKEALSNANRAYAQALNEMYRHDYLNEQEYRRLIIENDRLYNEVRRTGSEASLREYEEFRQRRLNHLLEQYPGLVDGVEGVRYLLTPITGIVNLFR